jgi:hypothetical protein
MNKHDFKYGPISIGVFQGVCAVSILVPFVYPEYIAHYLILIFFLAFSLRPILLKTGLHELIQSIGAHFGKWHYRGITGKQRKEIDRKLRDDKYRRQCKKDPKLPKNWWHINRKPITNC